MPFCLVGFLFCFVFVNALFAYISTCQKRESAPCIDSHEPSRCGCWELNSEPLEGFFKYGECFVFMCTYMQEVDRSWILKGQQSFTKYFKKENDLWLWTQWYTFSLCYLEGLGKRIIWAQEFKAILDVTTNPISTKTLQQRQCVWTVEIVKCKVKNSNCLKKMAQWEKAWCASKKSWVLISPAPV